MINSIVILGGGTAGWMTANYLNATFGDKVKITLIESNRVGTIGVGEATFSTIKHFFSYLGLKEDEWMPACAATYKLAIRFEEWNQPGHYFYHPFERLPVVHGFSLADWWLALGGKGSFDQSCFLIPALCDDKRSPYFLNGELFEGAANYERSAIGRTTLAEQDAQFPYAYHFDAALLASYLRGRGERVGVVRVADDMVGVDRDERGWITGLHTREHGLIAGDLFIDCSGFRGLLINQEMGEPFLPYLESLPNDRAVALRVPAGPRRDGIAPYTTATAQDCGWIWTIPLYGRDGTGYVYSSEYCSPDEAERTIREFVGEAADGLEAIHLAMRVGRSRNSWSNNCVAIGLASGFVEPLESTGIFFIQHGIEQLVKHFPGEDWDPALRASYNKVVADCLDGVREFLFFHYYGSARDDTPYWKEAKKRTPPGSLGERIAAWQATLPTKENVWAQYHGFEPYSYAAMMLGLGRFRPRPRPALLQMDPATAKAEFASRAGRVQRLRAELPSQQEFLAKRYQS